MAALTSPHQTACANLKKLTLLHCSRHYSTTPPPPPPQTSIHHQHHHHHHHTGTNGKHARNYHSEDGVTQRDLFFNVLNANATRRDAKQYLARFQRGPHVPRNEIPSQSSVGVNLGGLYAPARAIADTPQFTQRHEQPAGIRREQPAAVPRQPLHVALVCLRTPEEIDDDTLDGLAVTWAQLVKLDMRIVLVVAAHNHPINVRSIRTGFAVQADRLCDAIDRHNPEGGRAVLNALESSADGQISLGMPDLVMDPLRRGMIPIIPSLAYTPEGKLVPVGGAEVMLAMTKHLSGREEPIALDRIIVLDNIGGIPSKERGDGAHVFINLQQEYRAISEELSEYSAASPSPSPTVYDQHQQNMSLVQSCLDLLPDSSSALLVTPHEAASSARRSDLLPSLGAGTRRQKNPLIHNLLTNKPLVSSSLPVARNPDTATHPSDNNINLPRQTSTVLRRGMPLTLIPTPPRATGWTPPPSGTTPLSLTSDPRIDFARLTHLIEDSFRKKLNIPHYLSRVSGRIAGLIIAGEYEGGAILTWEMPLGVNDPRRLVPYLDKFAVLQASQGSSGVADVVFQAMVRSCFPRGVVWRSRSDNPVNKWYFERCDGMWEIPGTGWTMFWIGDPDVVKSEERWADYVAVCRGIPPSLEGGSRE